MSPFQTHQNFKVTAPPVTIKEWDNDSGRAAAPSFQTSTTTHVRIDHKIGSNWPQIGQIWDFFKISFSTFWLGEPKCTKTTDL